MSKKTGQPAGGRLLRKPRAPAKKPESSNVDTQDTVIIQGYTAPELPESPPPSQLLPWGNSFTYEFVFNNGGTTGEPTEETIDIRKDARFQPQNKEPSHISNGHYEHFRDYTYVAGASPPPPSEFSFSPTKTDTEIIGQTPSQAGQKKPLSRNRTAATQETKYILDPIHRQRTNLGTYVEGQSLVKPFRPRGPPGLPARAPLMRPPPVIPVEEDYEEVIRYKEIPEFTLKDFLVKISQEQKVPIERVEQIVYSRHNYKKLQNMLADLVIHPRRQKVIKTVNVQMPDELCKTTPRVPQKQLVLEMAALIKEQMSTVMNADMRPVIRPLPKWSPDYKPDVPRPHTEIVLYEGGSPSKRTRDSTEISIKIQPELSAFNTNDALFHSSSARYFQGSRRSNSPFAQHDEGMISPSELAILDTLISGGSALSLKAHFICEMPDIEPLLKTITYLNLSFNDFRTIPYEVFEIENLSVLKLRNNPIREIPPEISRLKQLRTLVISFCLVSTLPVAMFNLKKLEHLDIAYNRVSFIPSEIKHMKQLRELNVEGNQLPAMPVGLMRLKNLKYLRVKNNFMHPLFWKDNAKNQPQGLLHLSALTLKQFDLVGACRGRVAPAIQQMIDSPSKCDCCRGPLYGPGLRMIRPVSLIFGIKNLPFMFRSCSPYCYSNFSQSTENLVEMLYGVSSDEKTKS